MLYFFEDNKMSLISQLFLKSYKITDNIIYAEGAGNLEDCVYAALSMNESECAVVQLHPTSEVYHYSRR